MEDERALEAASMQNGLAGKLTWMQYGWALSLRGMPDERH